MKNDKGLRVGIVSGPDSVNVRDLPGLTWMNVRDFDATCELLKERGYTVYNEGRDYEFLKCIAMRAPEGNVINVVYHKRKDEWEE